ncbi:N-acetylglucosaminyltransferase-like protein [Radiomyces spectabilis]|uniref:N-acetylglucosaminyltransferase-like protein n=1 Tax=Radiomyces spectabilis TaxID=64574 RepID=UPI002220C231|nr:N-acetylglucosaminyltransferase-like protein [Radiomyces spectabilis]KAI8379310.1 N-acetylglucosaminyltransferase-like protein [Radiomyces spectabilis]
MILSFSRRRKLLLLVVFWILSILSFLAYDPSLITDLGYYTRPIWDTNPQTFEVLPHYYAEDVSMANLCQLHGWTHLKDEERPRVFDAIVFSVELDLLEIRIRELWDVVDTFVILESNATFTGVSKPLVFKDHQDRFAFAASKVRHFTVEQYALPANEGPFYNENQMRHHMNAALKTAGIQRGDLLIMSDVDELIRGKTVDILRSCGGVPDQLHLQLRNYVYSFEFFVDFNSWRAHIEKYDPDSTSYRHGQVTKNILSDAGWHCSFCFRTIQDFQFKMQSYSHADRVRHQQLLDPDRIQKVICEGGEIFDMPPEAYTYKELVSKLGNIPHQTSAVGLPSYVLTHADRFQFLLPGECMRDIETEA